MYIDEMDMDEMDMDEMNMDEMDMDEEEKRQNNSCVMIFNFSYNENEKSISRLK